MNNRVLILVVTLFIVSCGKQDYDSNQKSTAGQEVKSSSAFDLFKAEFIEAMWQLDPIAASYQGVHKYDAELPIPSNERRQEKRIFVETWLSKLREVNYDYLSDSDQVDFLLIENNLASIEFYNTKLRSWEWNPSLYNIGGAFFQVINYRKHTLEKRIEDIDLKLNQVEAYYAQAQKNIKQPTVVHSKLAIEQLEEAKNIFNETLRDSLEKVGKDETFKVAFLAKIEKAVNAIDGYNDFLQTKFIDRKLDTTTFKSFRLGKEIFEEKFNLEVQSAYSAKEIFEAAVDAKQELHYNMARVSEILWEEYFPGKEMPGKHLELIKQVIDFAAKNHVHRDSFVTSIREQIPVIEKFVLEKELLTLNVDHPLIVRETPKYMRSIARVSISAPGPYDANAEAYYNITSLEDYTEEEAESYLREYNNYTLQMLNVQEAIPGSYTQLQYNNEASSRIKSLLRNEAMVNGWAVYASKMMMENDFGRDQMEMGLMYYKWNLRTVCNTILDYGVHVLGFTEEQAMGLLMKEAFQEKSEAIEKWRRARLSQVQLCSYFTGYYEILQLREELMNLQGDDFNLKTFHETFLSYGSAPVKYVRKLMLKKSAKVTNAKPNGA